MSSVVDVGSDDRFLFRRDRRRVHNEFDVFGSRQLPYAQRRSGAHRRFPISQGKTTLTISSQNDSPTSYRP